METKREFASMAERRRVENADRRRIIDQQDKIDALTARVAELEAIVRGYLATADAKPSKVKISDLATMDARARYALKGEK